MTLSVVLPVYRCADCLEHLHERLSRVLADLDVSYELIFVDDRSPDDAWRLLQRMHEADAHVRVVRLSRNFGQHAAITAGVAESLGDWIVVMDCDLQDPPEEIPHLFAKASEGFDIVFARRRRRNQPALRRLANRAYFVLRRVLSKTDLETEHANLSIMSRKAADAFLRLKDKHRNYLLILYWLGFEHTSIEFDHAERYAGRSSYTFAGLLQVAVDGLFFETAAFLRWIVVAGFFVSLLSIALALFFIASRFAHHAYPGWTSLAVIVLMTSGFIIISTGVAALYVGKVFEQVKDRPLYLVDERLRSETADGMDAETMASASASASAPAPAAGPRR